MAIVESRNPKYGAGPIYASFLAAIAAGSSPPRPVSPLLIQTMARSFPKADPLPTGDGQRDRGRITNMRARSPDFFSVIAMASCAAWHSAAPSVPSYLKMRTRIMIKMIVPAPIYIGVPFEIGVNLVRWTTNAMPGFRRQLRKTPAYDVPPGSYVRNLT